MGGQHEVFVFLYLNHCISIRAEMILGEAFITYKHLESVPGLFSACLALCGVMAYTL